MMMMMSWMGLLDMAPVKMAVNMRISVSDD